MNEETKLLLKVADALRWSMPYAEHGHEIMYPKETFEKDGYVSTSVATARKTLEEVENYIHWIKGNNHESV